MFFSSQPRSLILRCLLTLTLAALPCLLVEAGTEEKVVVQLKWKHAFQFAGHYAAVEQGYYREAGLAVELVEGGPETNFSEELATGRCQYAVALSSMLIHRQEGKPVVALAAVMQHSPEVLLVPEASGINNPHQMAGRTVAVSPEDTPALLAMFKNEGLAADAVKTIPYTFDLARMLKGEITGMGAYSTNEPFHMKQQKVPFRIIQPRDYGVDFYGDCLFTSDQEIQQHPERVQAFLKATLRGWEYAMDHREEMVQLVRSRYRCPHSPEALLYEAEEMAQLMFYELIDIGHMNEGRWKHIGDTYVRLGMLPQDYTLEGFLYDPNPTTNLRWLSWSLGGALISTLLLTGLVLVLMRTNRRIAEAEKDSQESKAMLQTILDTIPVGVFWKDRDSRILGCNRVFAEYVGLSGPDAAEGLTTAALPRRWRDPSDTLSDEEVFNQGRSILLTEQVLSNADGSQRHLYQSKVPLKDDTGATIGLLGIVENVTSLKEAQEHQARLKDRLLQVQKYESLHRLANGVCHHSNNILQALTSYAELARMQTPPGQARDFMDGVLRESQRVATLNRMLLTCTGHGLHQFENLSVHGFLQESLTTLKCCLPSAQLLEWNPRGEDALIHADRESLRHLLINLLTNASEAMEGKTGDITMQTGVGYCSVESLQEGRMDPPPAPGEYAFIEITDQGIGMTQEVMKMVFDPFFSTKFTGRGLGMAAVMGILKSHQGTIKIQSQPGIGTQVRVLLPVVKIGAETNPAVS